MLPALSLLKDYVVQELTLFLVQVQKMGNVLRAPKGQQTHSTLHPLVSRLTIVHGVAIMVTIVCQAPVSSAVLATTAQRQTHWVNVKHVPLVHIQLQPLAAPRVRAIPVQHLPRVM